MNLNATMLAQMVVFLVLAWFSMKFVWPPLIKAIDERMKKIADGLAAAEEGKAALAAADKRIEQTLTQASEEGQHRLIEAEKRAQMLANEVKANAKIEADRIIASAKAEADQQISKAREALRAEVAVLAIKGAEKILKREVNAEMHNDLLNQLKAEF